MNFNQDVLLAKNGPVTLRASCIENDGSYLTAVTPPDLSGIARVEVGTGQERVFGSIDGGYVLNIESMQGFVVRVESSLLGLNTGGDDRGPHVLLPEHGQRCRPSNGLAQGGRAGVRQGG
ncbi:MAG: hypothetical protein ABR538_01005 [Candidatus Binatia bacterium]